MKSNKLLALLLTVAMLFTMSMTAFAEGTQTQASKYNVTSMTEDEIEQAITATPGSNEYAGTNKLYHNVYKAMKAKYGNTSSVAWGMNIEKVSGLSISSYYRDVELSSNNKDASLLVIAPTGYEVIGKVINLNAKNNYTACIGAKDLLTFSNQAKCIVVPLTDEVYREWYKISGSTDTYENFKADKMEENSTIDCAEDVNVSFKMYDYELSGTGKVEVTGGAKEFNCATSEPAIRVGSQVFTYYSSLELACKSDNITSNETLTVLKDITTKDVFTLDKTVTIDLNGHTWNFEYAGGYAMDLSRSLTIKNGTINLDNVFTNHAFSILKSGAVLRLNNVTVVGEMSSAGAGVVFCEPGVNADVYILNNSNINLKANNTGRLVTNVDAVIENSNVTLEEFDGGFAGSNKVSVKGNSVITVKNSNHALSKAELTMEGTSKLAVTGCQEAGIKLDNGSKVILNDASVVSMSNNNADFVYRDGVDPTAVNVEIKVAENATLDAKIPAELAANATITGKALAVSVEFEATSKANEYNIVLVSAENKKIKEFTSAQLQFVKENDEIGYEIVEENDKISVNEQGNDIYLFNLKNGENIVGNENKIVIGKVVFDGYSDEAVGFKVAADYENKVIATKGQNLTDTFNVENGKLTVNDEEKGIIDAIFAEPKCEVTINVAMNEPVVDNKVAYQDMKVVVSGADLAEPIVFNLGTDGNAQNDNNYKVTATLKQDKKYVITVTGAGYRKAQYTLKTKGKETATVNFWNNVQLESNELEMETGIADSKVNANFIAGDIVKDNKLNIYDLSAVVAYFGDSTTDTTNAWDKAKYDLNRDGKIDATDVSIVLDAWKALDKLGQN